MKTISEVLEEFREKFRDLVIPDLFDRGLPEIDCIHAKQKYENFIESYFRTAIESLLDESVVELIKKDYSQRKDVLAECAWDSGWNSAREEQIKKIKEIKR